ncbi:uncharacterized protein PGTG_21794 [Puccinia graminis f. sp. tritici CRL 75-36-700-3]|uniref:CxC1-like cysteine cluster associated with KDZ transposases domain-containing protein n=1 Tax=Puccinia graminis f. sp. tritici (strain CRL 75-36-700-3 / race SCCL) TaxID=418459 RepID=H6QSI1_PUCGT|nr:uncharacterized protein PGTG_21794 [Puccinia graminis f. sp. tritici CRL 75-36-700-3]EHS63718.1 hypothetical protein PGTG_21794 [Puccinia graminis f. sp. tritici CRL 75-36-700-3]
MFRQLEEKRKKSIFSVLGLSNQEVLASSSCPACFGPQPPNLSDYTANMRNRLIVCLDGNFQHRHQIKASRNHEKLRTPQFFISQADVDIVSQEIRHQEAQGMTPEQADRCTESHKAADDKRNESTWKGCDDTGLMGCCCRHDAAIYLTNIYKSGEQRHFPMTIIKKLLSDIEPNRQVGIFANSYHNIEANLNLEHQSSMPMPTTGSANLNFILDSIKAGGCQMVKVLRGFGLISPLLSAP